VRQDIRMGVHGGGPPRIDDDQIRELLSALRIGQRVELPDLSRRNFSGLDLERMSFRKARLCGADLTRPGSFALTSPRLISLEQI